MAVAASEYVFRPWSVHRRACAEDQPPDRRRSLGVSCRHRCTVILWRPSTVRLPSPRYGHHLRSGGRSFLLCGRLWSQAVAHATEPASRSRTPIRSSCRFRTRGVLGGVGKDDRGLDSFAIDAEFGGGGRIRLGGVGRKGLEAVADGADSAPEESVEESIADVDPVEEIVDEVVVHVWRELDRRHNISEKLGWPPGAWREEDRQSERESWVEGKERGDGDGDRHGGGDQDEKEERLRILFQVRKMVSGRVKAGQEAPGNEKKQVYREFGLDVDQLVTDALRAVDEARSEVGTLLRAAKSGIKKAPSKLGPRGMPGDVNDWRDVRTWSGSRWLAIGICLTSLMGVMWWAVRRRRATPSLPSSSQSVMEAAIPYPTPENAAAILKKVVLRQQRKRAEDLALIKHVKVGGRRVRVERAVGEDGQDFEQKYLELQTLGERQREGGGDEQDSKSVWVESLLPKGLAGQLADKRDEAREEGEKDLGWSERLDAWKNGVLAKRGKGGDDNLDGVFVVDRGSSPVPYQEHVRKTWWRYRPTMAYSDLLRQIQGGQVRKAAYSQDLRQLYVQMKDGFPAELKVSIPADPFLRDLMTIADVEVSEMPVSLLVSGLQVAALMLPTVMMVKALGLKKSRRDASLEEAEEMKDVIKESWAENEERTNAFLWRVNMPQNLPRRDERIREALRNGIGLEVFDTPTQEEGLLEDVVGMPKVKSIIREYLKIFSDPGFFQQFGIIIPKGILLHGPPGCGKTLFARAMAVECGLPFIAVGGSELMELISIQGHSVIRSLFAAARYLAPCIVFIDEIDALASRSVEEDEERNIIIELLYMELDSLEGPHQVMDVDQSFVIIGATNRVEELAAGFLQPGRMEKLVYVGRPTWRDRLDIFEVHKRGHKMGTDVDFSKIVYRTAGMSGADIKNLINEAGLLAVRESRDHIDQKDFVAVLDRMLFESVTINLTKEELEEKMKLVPKDNEQLLALHEAGHVVLSMLYPNYDLLTFVLLYPGGQERAMSVYYPRNERFDIPGSTVGYVKMHMVVAFGGICAEKLFFGENQLTDGGSDDLMKISNLARELLVAGVSNKLGLFQLLDRKTKKRPYPYDQIPLLPSEWQDRSNEKPLLSPEMGELFTREVMVWTEWAENEAMEALRKNKHIVEAVANELIKRRKLTGEEVKDIVDSMNPHRLPDLMEYPSLEEVLEVEIVVDPNKAGPYEPLDVYAAPLHRC